MRALFDYLSFFQLDLKDVIQILIVAYIIYRLLILWAGTRAFQILIGLVLLFTIYAVAQVLDLGLITAILNQAFTYGAFALIVVFYPELRNALARLGRSQFWGFFSRQEQSEVVEEVVKAAERLSRAKIGAIIAIEREVGLGDYAEEGTELDAVVSAAVLSTIFTPYAPLHDGAVIISGRRIKAASVVLPLTQFPVDKSLGTRHRAALGLSEETDAFVIVISEETSQISLADRGRLYRGLSTEALGQRLMLGRAEPTSRGRPILRRRSKPLDATEKAALPSREGG